MHVKKCANVETTKPAKEEKDEPTKIVEAAKIEIVKAPASTLQICQTTVALETPVCTVNIPTVSVPTATQCLANEETNSTSTIATINTTATTSSHETTLVHKHIFGPPNNYCNRRSWITTERMNELRRKAQEAVKQNKTFTIRGCFSSVRNALTTRGWVEKLDLHRKHVPTGICQVTYDELAQGLPKRKPGETRRQYILKCERNITSRFLEHMPIDFLWTNRKEKCDYIDQAKNPGMTINKFHRVPFTSKEGLCSQLKDFHWFYEEGTAEMYFPRCFNVWSPEELGEFVDNFKLTATIAFIRWMVDKYRAGGFDAVFSLTGTIPYSSIDFAYKRCTEYLDNCEHNDIDLEDPPRIWEHDWDAFLYQQYQMANEGGKILCDPHRALENLIKTGAQLLENMKTYWPQYSLDGYQNLWIVKPANKCRGRGIQLVDNLKKILAVVNPSIASKSRYVVQKYIERPLIIHHTKFDIRQWFLITNVQPLVVWMYKESYLRFSSQEYSLTNHHESVHLTNHAIQKKYTNGKRDKRLPSENMWDCYSFQAYLRQIGKQDMWLERIYPGMRKAIVGTMLASQENMDRRPNTFELFGADFMICEDFNPWLIEINSSPDLGATTSVTARMCPQCLDDVVKVVIDRRTDPKADLGNFVLIYRQVVPPTPAYMGLNLFVKGKQIITKVNHNHGYYYHQRKERSLITSNFFRQKTTLTPAISNVHKVMPTFNATEFMEKCLNSGALNSTRSSINGQQQASPSHSAGSLSARQKVPFTVPTSPCPNLLRTLQSQIGIRRSFTKLSRPNPGAINAADSSAQEASSVPPKRYRSCGPRLTAPLANEGEKKFKFIIKKCTIQKSLADRSQPPELETTESAQVVDEKLQSDTKPVPSKRATDNGVDDLLYKVKGLLRDNRSSPNLLNHQQEVSPLQSQSLHLRSQSCIVEPKHFRRISTTSGNSIVDCRKWRPKPKPTSSNTFEEKKAMHRSAEQLAESSTRIHTIGRGIASWKSSTRNLATKSTTNTTSTTTPTPTTTTITSTSMKTAASVYACKRNASMVPSELTRMKHQMSPRRTRRHSYQRSETRNLKC